MKVPGYIEGPYGRFPPHVGSVCWLCFHYHANAVVKLYPARTLTWIVFSGEETETDYHGMWRFRFWHGGDGQYHGKNETEKVTSREDWTCPCAMSTGKAAVDWLIDWLLYIFLGLLRVGSINRLIDWLTDWVEELDIVREISCFRALFMHHSNQLSLCPFSRYILQIEPKEFGLGEVQHSTAWKPAWKNRFPFALADISTMKMDDLLQNLQQWPTKKQSMDESEISDRHVDENSSDAVTVGCFRG